MKANDAALALIREYEGLRTTAYRDPVGIWTIGYGHTDAAGTPKVTSGLSITASEAAEILRRDLGQYEEAVSRRVTVPLNENQFGALVSFTFNLGAANLGSSTLLRKLNAGDYDGAAAEFGKWNRAGGKVLAGLTRRRAAERALFEQPIGSAQTITTPETIRRGSKGETVRLLQSRLRGLGYDLIADGAFGRVTEAAVKQFQSKRGLAADGIIGAATWAALEA